MNDKQAKGSRNLNSITHHNEPKYVVSIIIYPEQELIHFNLNTAQSSHLGISDKYRQKFYIWKV